VVIAAITRIVAERRIAEPFVPVRLATADTLNAFVWPATVIALVARITLIPGAIGPRMTVALQRGERIGHVAKVVTAAGGGQQHRCNAKKN
jgi:hypothetical protein